MMNDSNKFHFFLVTMIALNGIAIAQPDNGEVLGSLDSDPALQPYVRVLANPERFDGEVVSVTGYYMKGTHVNNLFVNEDACMSFDTVNSMTVDGRLIEKNFQACTRTTAKGR